MNNFTDKCPLIVSEVQELLRDNTEWIERYSDYATALQSNFDTIQSIKRKKFNEWPPLFLYMNISEAKGSMNFSLRYLGQNVATLKANSKKITVSTKGFDESNKKYFDYEDALNNEDWRSAKATDFRRYFSAWPKRNDEVGKKNDEHRIESLLLSEFSKKKGEDKCLCNIQPVKISGVARFQMPTPLGGSEVAALKYSGIKGGGIDILSRFGKGKGTKLCIMEVKDENVVKEPPDKTILQALAYATFIRELLRNKNGQQWWELFGFTGKLPKKLDLGVACVMPSNHNDDTSFAGKSIEVGEDIFSLHYLYFEEAGNAIKNIKASF